MTYFQIDFEKTAITQLMDRQNAKYLTGLATDKLVEQTAATLHRRAEMGSFSGFIDPNWGDYDRGLPATQQFPDLGIQKVDISEIEEARENPASSAVAKEASDQILGRAPDPEPTADPELAWVKEHPWPADKVMKMGPKVIKPDPKSDPFPRPRSRFPRKKTTFKEALGCMERARAEKFNAPPESKQPRPWPADGVMKAEPITLGGQKSNVETGSRSTQPVGEAAC